jgi:hypothetical protein
VVEAAMAGNDKGGSKSSKTAASRTFVESKLRAAVDRVWAELGLPPITFVDVAPEAEDEPPRT